MQLEVSILPLLLVVFVELLAVGFDQVPGLAPLLGQGLVFVEMRWR